MAYKPPSIADLVLATLLSAGSSKIFRDILREQRLKKYKKESIRVELSRLHSKGYIKYSPTGWHISGKGKSRIRQTFALSYIPSPFSHHAQKNLIMSFDIPEKKRVLRNWLRNQIKIFGYEMLQQSLWIGPSPLPAEFLKRLNTLNIRKNIKTLRKNKESS